MSEVKCRPCSNNVDLLVTLEIQIAQNMQGSASGYCHNLVYGNLRYWTVFTQKDNNKYIVYMLYILSRYRQHITHTYIENINKLNAPTKYENKTSVNSNCRICQLLRRKTFQNYDYCRSALYLPVSMATMYVDG